MRAALAEPQAVVGGAFGRGFGVRRLVGVEGLQHLRLVRPGRQDVSGERPSLGVELFDGIRGRAVRDGGPDLREARCLRPLAGPPDDRLAVAAAGPRPGQPQRPAVGQPRAEPASPVVGEVGEDPGHMDLAVGQAVGAVVVVQLDLAEQELHRPHRARLPRAVRADQRREGVEAGLQPVQAPQPLHRERIEPCRHRRPRPAVVRLLVRAASHLRPTAPGWTERR